MRSVIPVIPAETVIRAVQVVRGQKVLLDAVLAELYGVPTKVLVQAVKRNIDRFPPDFMFELTDEESQSLGQGEAPGRGGRRYAPYAFTEQGVAMLSSVLRSRQAVQVNIAIMRAFVELRQMLASHAVLAERLDDLERKYDSQFKAVFDAIRALMNPPQTAPRKPIGFQTESEGRGKRPPHAARRGTARKKK